MQVKEEISSHLKDRNRGEKLREGARAVIVGPPNAGKSSLMNILGMYTYYLRLTCSILT